MSDDKNKQPYEKPEAKPLEDWELDSVSGGDDDGTNCWNGGTAPTTCGPGTTAGSMCYEGATATSNNCQNGGTANYCVKGTTGNNCNEGTSAPLHLYWGQ